MFCSLNQLQCPGYLLLKYGTKNKKSVRGEMIDYQWTKSWRLELTTWHRNQVHCTARKWAALSDDKVGERNRSIEAVLWYFEFRTLHSLSYFLKMTKGFNFQVIWRWRFSRLFRYWRNTNHVFNWKHNDSQPPSHTYLLLKMSIDVLARDMRWLLI